jgi:Holliday junction resolvase RusA-like endonuclease
MLTPPRYSPELLNELQKDWPDPIFVRKEIFLAYNRDNAASQISNAPTRDELDQVVSWLNKEDEPLLTYFLKRRSVLMPAFSTSLSSKVSLLSQFNCPICRTSDGLFPVEIFPIQIPPVSKQVVSQKKGYRAAFELAIKHRFSKKEASFSKDDRLCVMIVFVTSRKRRTKDLDNMAKAMLDAVKGVLFGDDRSIDHLNLLRLVSEDEEYVYLNIRKTKINEHHDVLSKHMHHSWAGAETLNLEDFLP